MTTGAAKRILNARHHNTILTTIVDDDDLCFMTDLYTTEVSSCSRSEGPSGPFGAGTRSRSAGARFSGISHGQGTAAAGCGLVFIEYGKAVDFSSKQIASSIGLFDDKDVTAGAKAFTAEAQRTQRNRFEGKQNIYYFLPLRPSAFSAPLR